MIRTITNILFFAIVFALPSGVVLAAGQNDLQNLLRGDYRLIGSESCVDSVNGFGEPPVLQPLGPTTSVIASMSGLVNFDGNGIAVATLKAMGVIDNPLGFPVFTISASDFTCNFTYTVNPDRSFTMEQSICTGDIVYGPGAEVTKIEITGGESEGFIGQFKQVLTTSKVEPTEQVMTFNGFFGAKRLCTHTWTLVRARNARE